MKFIQKFVINILFLNIFTTFTGLSLDKLPKEKFIASKIPSDLLMNTDAVIRHEATSFTVSDISNAALTIHRVITVLNPAGQNYSKIFLAYDKYIKIEDLDGALYDAEGNEIRSMESNDIKDYSATSDYSLYDDNRVKAATLIYNTFPYTVEFKYEIEYDNYLNWPSWYPEEENASVEYSKYEVTIPSGSNLRYRTNFEVIPKVTTNKKSTTYLWETSSLPRFELEPRGPSYYDQCRFVKIAPDKFEVDGYAGDLSSWKSFGDWFHKLYMNRQNIPDKERQQIVAITLGITDKKEQVKRLYEYLQTKTRYVSIQLGLGGWQPFDANYVREKGYGDCKALTNYMLSMLNVINIEAYPALIYNDPLPRRVLTDFPINEFNHVILFVPLGEDTTWLECTSQTIPFGHIGKNNENRYALVVSPKGGELIKTPSSVASDNREIIIANVSITNFGDGVAEVQKIYTGNQQDYIRIDLKDATPKEREDWLKENIDIPSFQIKKKDFSQLEAKSNIINFSYQLDLPHYAATAGKRLLFQPKLLEKLSYVPKPIERRKHPVIYAYPFIDVDTIYYKIPDGIKIEAMPKPVLFETSFAKFKSDIIILNAETLLYTRYYEMNSTSIPPDTYAAYRKFLKDVVQADKNNVVLVKN